MPLAERYNRDGIRIYQGDCMEVLGQLDPESVNCCVTSPPYWGLRDYGTDGQIGLEETLDDYVGHIVKVFREVRRVLRDDGTLWLNLGDAYTSGGRGTYRSGASANRGHEVQNDMPRPKTPASLKPKDLCGIPWRVAFALQADGWYLRQDIIWHKPNPMPESVTDRCTKSHEYIFLLSKSPRYYFDQEAIKEAVSGTAHARGHGVNLKAVEAPSGWDTENGSHGRVHKHGRTTPKQNTSFAAAVAGLVDTRNKRSVWTVTPKPYKGAHFATFPPELITPCILAGCPVGGTVLDPFLGSGTTAEVAKRNGRQAIGCEIKADYIDLAIKRLRQGVLEFT